MRVPSWPLIFGPRRLPPRFFLAEDFMLRGRWVWLTRGEPGHRRVCVRGQWGLKRGGAFAGARRAFALSVAMVAVLLAACDGTSEDDDADTDLQADSDVTDIGFNLIHDSGASSTRTGQKPEETFVDDAPEKSPPGIGFLVKGNGSDCSLKCLVTVIG